MVLLKKNWVRNGSHSVFVVEVLAAEMSLVVSTHCRTSLNHPALDHYL